MVVRERLSTLRGIHALPAVNGVAVDNLGEALRAIAGDSNLAEEISLAMKRTADVTHVERARQQERADAEAETQRPDRGGGN